MIVVSDENQVGRTSIYPLAKMLGEAARNDTVGKRLVQEEGGIAFPFEQEFQSFVFDR